MLRPQRFIPLLSPHLHSRKIPGSICQVSRLVGWRYLAQRSLEVAGQIRGQSMGPSLRRTGLTWPRVSPLPQEPPGLNGPFMGSGRQADWPCPLPAQRGARALALFTVYPELASTGMWFQTGPPQVPATMDNGAVQPPSSSSVASPWSCPKLPCPV